MNRRRAQYTPPLASASFRGISPYGRTRDGPPEDSGRGSNGDHDEGRRGAPESPRHVRQWFLARQALLVWEPARCESIVTIHRDGLECGLVLGYTPGMKTAVSIPDQVFEQAERLARRTRKSRSNVFSSALREYLARHSPDEVTEAMDLVCEQLGKHPDPFVARAARRTLEQTEW